MDNATLLQPYHITEDGGLSLDFHPGQWDAWDSTQRFIFILAGTQGQNKFPSPLAPP